MLAQAMHVVFVQYIFCNPLSSTDLILSWIYVILGLANKKTVTIQREGKDQSVLLATTKTKKQNKPSTLLHKSVMKKEFPRMAKAVTNQVKEEVIF